MQQLTAAHPDPITKTFGSVTITASLPVDGGYAINTFVGAERIHALSFTTADRDTYRAAYAVIRDGGRQGVSVEGIREALDAALRNELFRMQERHDTPSRNRIEHINLVLDRLEQPADTARMDELAADLLSFATKVGDTVAAGVSDHDRPTTFRELRDAYARDIRNQRAGVA